MRGVSKRLWSQKSKTSPVILLFFFVVQISTRELFKMHPSITSRTAVRRPPVIVLFHVGLAVVASALLVGPQPVESHLAEEFSIQQLLTKRFPHRISDDIYLDPCKAGNKTLSYFSSKQTSNRKLHVNCNSLPLTNKTERRTYLLTFKVSGGYS